MEGILAKIAVALHIISPASEAPTRPPTPVIPNITKAEPLPRCYCEDDETYEKRTSRVYWHDAYYHQEDEDSSPEDSVPDKKG